MESNFISLVLKCNIRYSCPPSEAIVTIAGSHVVMGIVSNAGSTMNYKKPLHANTLDPSYQKRKFITIAIDKNA